MSLELDGKVAIVSGAGAGLGRAHALRLAADGAAVVVNDISADAAHATATAITDAGGRASVNVSPAGSWDAALGLVEQAVADFGDLHIVVNNAGFIRDRMSFSMTEEEFDSVVNVHLKGHFCLARHAGVWWRDQAKAGSTTPRRIINTTSEAGLFGAAGQANYAPAKSGIVALTWVFARELGRYNVTSNCIAPRARTDMTQGQTFFTAPVDGFDKYDPANVSAVVAWLASDRTSDVNAQLFLVVGGDVQLIAPFKAVTAISQDAAWTIDGLEAARPQLFGDRVLEPPSTNVGL